jgi:signal transduction histidine kinase
MEKFGKKNFRVLIVDDIEDIHTDIRKILSWGPAPASNLQRLESALFDSAAAAVATLPKLRIDSAYQGAQAIEMVKAAQSAQDPYHLIFMDVRMPPGMDGVEAAQTIWQIQPDVGVVICTAYSDYSIDAILGKLGISDKLLFLTKPFSAAVLKQSAVTMLRKWDLDHQLQAQMKNLEERVAEQTSLLLQSSKMAALGEMAAGIAHEVNTPLCVIKLVTQQVEDTRFQPEKTKESLGTIVRMVDRIAKIITALKTISRTSQGEPFQPASLPKLVDEVLSLCRERFAAAGVDLQIAPLPDLSIECRPIDISQVILNLLNNAFDAASDLPEKWVQLELLDQEETVEFRVTDSGSGIAEELSERIFSPFFTTKEIGKGTGLGLSVSRGLVDAHNGKIRVDTSAPHTSFVVTLPKTQPVRA